MKKVFFNLMAITLLVGAITGCSKEPKDLLTAHGWKMSSFVLEQAGTPAVDIFGFWEACEKDDFTTFLENGTAVQDQGTLKCDSTAAQTSEGTWSLSSDEKTLTTTGGGETVNWTIITLESDLLKASAIQPDLTDSLDITVTATWIPN